VTTTRRNVSRVLIIAGNSLTVIGLGVLSGAFLGLGLGIVQRLCERNGWSFSLDVDDVRVSARISW